MKYIPLPFQADLFSNDNAGLIMFLLVEFWDKKVEKVKSPIFYLNFNLQAI